ncbi:hypothetical protein AHiyo4_13430 [Arthrobacter sp. Hiyo4]|nr:hypothetical protein AHiyo4_13430 [Arthrobacter sp. Hiyo4]
MPFGQADAADIHGFGGSDSAGGTEDELRAAAAEVNHQHLLAVEDGQDAAGPGERQGSFFIARDYLRFNAQQFPDPVHKTWRLRASRLAEVATKRMDSAPYSRIMAA